MTVNEPRTLDVREGRPTAGVGDVFLRIVLGGLFLVSAYTKLKTPLDFAFAIKAFHLGFTDGQVVFGAYAIPWFEGLLGLLLVTGVWVRSAALLSSFLMLGFIAGIASLKTRGLDVTCPCFGTLKLFCSGPMGACHIVRNSIIAAIGARLVFAYRVRV